MRTGGAGFGPSRPASASFVCRGHLEVQAISPWLTCTSALAPRHPQATLFHFGNSTMRHYSAFQLDPTGHVAGRIDLNCIDDEDAKRQAEMLVDTFGLELWEDDRMVAVFTKKKVN
jgi:hypothetical protein